VEFELLGTLRARAVDGELIDLGPPKVRALLAILLARADEFVPKEVLCESLWIGRRPHNVHNALQINAHRLRRLLDEPDRLTCRAGGYRLAVRAGEVDRQRFEDLVCRARAVRDAGNIRPAGDLLRQALLLWRGRPFGEFPDVNLLTIESQALTEQWIAAQEELAELDLADDRQAGVLEGLRLLVAEHPYRERAHELLMRALVRAGCPGEALRHYNLLRGRLADELGTDPSVRLRQLHQRILREDPTLLDDLEPVGAGR
jgi:DNA-binding SARP family transcriptional activator